MLQFADQPISKTEIWQTSFKLCITHFWQLYFFVLVFQVLSQGFHLLIGHAYYPNLSLKREVALRPEFHSGHYGAMVGGDLVLFLLFIFIFSLIISYLGSYMKGEKSELMISMKWVAKHYFYLLLLACFTMLLSLMGFILFIWPGLFLMVAFYSFYPYIIVEGQECIPALKMALKITWGKWWRAFLTMLIPALSIVILDALATLLLAWILTLFGMSEHNILMICSVIQIFVTAFMILWILAMQLVLWNDLKIRYAIKQRALSSL